MSETYSSTIWGSLNPPSVSAISILISSDDKQRILVASLLEKETNEEEFAEILRTLLAVVAVVDIAEIERSVEERNGPVVSRSVLVVVLRGIARAPPDNEINEDRAESGAAKLSGLVRAAAFARCISDASLRAAATFDAPDVGLQLLLSFAYRRPAELLLGGTLFVISPRIGAPLEQRCVTAPQVTRRCSRAVKKPLFFGRGILSPTPAGASIPKRPLVQRPN